MTDKKTIINIVLSVTLMRWAACAEAGNDIARNINREDSRVTVEQSGAPWTRRIVVSVEPSGHLIVEQSKSLAGSDSMRRRVPIPPPRRAELRKAIAELASISQANGPQGTDPSRVTVSVVTRSGTLTRTLRSPYGKKAIKTIESINLYLPADAHLTTQ